MQRSREPNTRLFAVLTAFLLVSAVTARVVASTRGPGEHELAAPVDSQPTPTAEQLLQAGLVDSLDGLSDKLRFHLVEDTSATAMATPVEPIQFMPLLPFEAKKNGRLGAYRLGYWPAEKGRALSPAYANPAGFIEVTPENAQTRVSDHFELHDFLTHDQQSVWPKYLVLREPLIDKLELVIADLNAHGIPARHLTVMSGFRTPQYNEQGVGEGGRAKNSRHQYGDAADVFVDNNGDRVMDDLNGDGRTTKDDARVILRAVERVEHAYPELIGGAGLYSSTGAHGPFIHIDARGQRARWGGA